MNAIPISQAQYDALFKAENWAIEELSLQELKMIPRVARPSDHIGGFISGSLDQLKALNGHDSVAGIDLLCYEANPRTSAGEGSINVYHYIVKRSKHPFYPYLIIGPYRDETVIGHWPTGLNLRLYGR